MATKYQIEIQFPDGSWTPLSGTLYPTQTMAEIICVSTYHDKKTRVVPVAEKTERAAYVPDKMPAGERAAEIVHIKALAEDLASDKANYAATLESIVVRARRLFDDEARLIGRGYKDGENQACQACDGVYPKEAK